MKKAQSADEAVDLKQIPNVGPSLAQNLRFIGVRSFTDLRGKNGYTLYEKLNRKTKTRHDLCVCDTFLAAIDFMNGGKTIPGWAFTAERKKKLSRQH